MQKQIQRAPRAVKETPKKKQKIGQTPPGELGSGGVTPFLLKKNVQRVKLASPEDPKIVEIEV